MDATAKPTAPASPVAERRSPEVRMSEAREERLPAFYDAGVSDFLGRVQNLEPEYRYRWIQVSAKNQQLKRFKGWEPVELDRANATDMAWCAKWGFDPVLINRAGRIQWIDVELWRMPRARAELIRRHLNDKLARRSASVRATLDALSEDVAGRSKGRVIPFVTSGTPGEDVFDRTQVSESGAARPGKTK